MPVKPVNGAGAELIIAAGGQSVDSGLQAITTGGITMFSSTTTVQFIHCLATTATTLTITDKSGTPVTYFPAVAMAANSVMIASYGTIGMSFNAGLIISAGANSAISCRAVGVQAN